MPRKESSLAADKEDRNGQTIRLTMTMMPIEAEPLTVSVEDS